ncbi:MAG: helix-turn-helix transcriptional regulator [Candidatus Hydrogenedentes bacterium]|nr:helix-turn-helix transcriptional regulator [Candidatus Hydrogenedentota bacterium]
MDRAAVERLIRERFGTQAAFLRRAGMDKATLHRWFNGEHHPRPETFLRFCGALDVDFLSVLEVSPERLAGMSYGIGRAALGNDWRGALSTFAFLTRFLVMPGEWPGDCLLAEYDQGRIRPGRWHTWDYEHDPATQRHDYYGTICLTGSANPQVWYVAFQEPAGVLG